MPTLVAPDGRRLRVPDDATPEQIQSVLQQQYPDAFKAAPARPAAPAAAPATDDAIARYDAAAAAPVAAPAAPAPMPTAAATPPTATGNPRAVDLAGRSITQGLAGIPDAITRGANLVTGLIPGPGLLSPFNPVNPRSVAQIVRGERPIGGVQAPSARGALSEALTARGVPLPETPTERVASAAGEGLTAGLATGGGAPLAAAGGTLGGGAAQTAAEFGAPEWLQQAIGLAAGLAPGAARAAVGRAPAGLQSTVDRVTEAGGQIRRSGATPSAVTDTARALPGSGGRSTYAADVKSINNRVADTIGSSGKTDLPSRYPAARERASNEFDDFARSETLTLTQPLVGELVALAKSTQQVGGAPAQAATIVMKALEEAAQTGRPMQGATQVSGDLFKRLDTALGKIEGAGAAKQALRDQFKSTLPATRAAQWDDLMRRYGDLSAVEKLASKYWAQGREIPPKELLAATSGKGYGQQRRTATGSRGDLGTLATEGQYVRAPAFAGGPSLGLGAGAGALGASTGPGSVLPLYGIMAGLGRLSDSPLLSSQGMRRVAVDTGLGGIAGASVTPTPPPKKKKK